MLEVSDFGGEKVIPGKLRRELVHVADGLVILVLAAEKQAEHDFGVHGVFAVALGDLAKIVETFLRRSTQPGQGRRHLHAPGQAANHVVVSADDHFRVDVAGIEFEHSFVIVARAHGVAQGGKPSPLHQARIHRELGASNAPAVESVHVLRILFEFLLFEILGAAGQLLDAVLDLDVGGAGGAANEAVIGVVAGVHGSSIVEVVHENDGQQMVDGEGIVGMLVEDFLELLGRAIVSHVIEIVEGGLSLGIVRGAVRSVRGGLRLAQGGNARRGQQAHRH